MTNETMIPHGEGPVICSECRKRIRSRQYWRRYDDGKIVFVCNKCAKSMIDERSANGLMMVVDIVSDDDTDNDAAYEFEIQAARKGEE